MSTSSPFQRRIRIVNGLALSIAIISFGSLCVGMVIHEGGQPAEVVSASMVLMFGCIPVAALVILAGFISLVMVVAAWLKDRQRPKVIDVIVLIVALATCIPVFLWGGFAFGFGGPTTLSQLCGAGFIVASLLIVFLIPMTIWLIVIARREPN